MTSEYADRFPPRWDYRDGLPVLLGHYPLENYAKMWSAISKERDERSWRLGAIAHSLQRSLGGRPSSGSRASETQLQKFCKWVNVDRQQLHRFCRTYRVFFENSSQFVTSSGESLFADPRLKYSHFEVAARLASSPKEAIAWVKHAHKQRWTAKLLEQRMEDRLKKKPTAFSLDRVLRLIQIESLGWTPEQRADAAEDMRRAADAIAPPPSFEVEEFEALEQIA